MTEFDDARTLTAGRAELTEGWVIGEAVNGGLLMSLATRAAADALSAVDVTLSAEEVAFLEEPYRPHEVAGFV